jgi:hypothetical protein
MQTSKKNATKKILSYLLALALLVPLLAPLSTQASIDPFLFPGGPTLGPPIVIPHNPVAGQFHLRLELEGDTFVRPDEPTQTDINQARANEYAIRVATALENVQLDTQKDTRYTTFNETRTALADAATAAVTAGLPPGVTIWFGEESSGTFSAANSGTHGQFESYVRINVGGTWNNNYEEPTAAVDIELIYDVGGAPLGTLGPINFTNARAEALHYADAIITALEDLKGIDSQGATRFVTEATALAEIESLIEDSFTEEAEFTFTVIRYEGEDFEEPTDDPDTDGHIYVQITVTVAGYTTMPLPAAGHRVEIYFDNAPYSGQVGDIDLVFDEDQERAKMYANIIATALGELELDHAGGNPGFSVAQEALDAIRTALNTFFIAQSINHLTVGTDVIVEFYEGATDDYGDFSVGDSSADGSIEVQVTVLVGEYGTYTVDQVNIKIYFDDEDDDAGTIGAMDFSNVQDELDEMRAYAYAEIIAAALGTFELYSEQNTLFNTPNNATTALEAIEEAGNSR